MNETKTHTIDGVTYREVDRKAEVGERVIVVGNESEHGFFTGEIVLTVRETFGGVRAQDIHGKEWYLRNSDYLVLEPVEKAPEPAEPTEPDMVESPPHYNAGRFEVIDVIEDAVKGADGFEGACVANILKYTMRYRHKNGLEDVKKAAWYLARLERYLTERDGVK